MKKKQAVSVKGINFKVEAYDFYRFTKSETLVYSLIVSYWRAKMPFYMTNKSIAITLNVSERTVIRAVLSLQTKRVILVDRSANARIIREPLANERAKTENLLTLFDKVFSKLN